MSKSRIAKVDANVLDASAVRFVDGQRKHELDGKLMSVEFVGQVKSCE